MPAQDGAGWLVRLMTCAPEVLISIGLLVTLWSLSMILRPRARRLQGEERLLLLFVTGMLLAPLSALIGVSVWFATLSILAALALALSFVLASVAFMLRD